MKKIVLAILCLALMVASACSPSPTAIQVGANRVDASEYAFYLSQNKKATGQGPYSAEESQDAREAAINQVVTNEVIRLKCKELGLTPAEDALAELKETKESLVDSLGGKAAYLEYLNSHLLTDRSYDKFQLNQLYYRLLYSYVTEELEQERYTDENMRRMFAENYVRVKYVKLSLVDEEGKRLPATQLTEKMYLAEYIYMELTEGEADFDSMVEGLGEDKVMTDNPSGIVVSRTEAGGAPHLMAAFDLTRGQVGSVLETPDALYIVTRLEIPAGYYDANEAAILADAKAAFFTEALAEWKESAVVTVSKSAENMDLNNMAEYVK